MPTPSLIAEYDRLYADAKPVHNHPLTRKDEADMAALINGVLCGGDITNIGDERGTKLVTSDEVLTGDIYHTHYTQEIG